MNNYVHELLILEFALTLMVYDQVQQHVITLNNNSLYIFTGSHANNFIHDEDGQTRYSNSN